MRDDAPMSMKRRRVPTWVKVAVPVLLVGGCVAGITGQGDGTKAAQPAAASSAGAVSPTGEEATGTASLGQPATVGDRTVTIHTATCGARTIGPAGVAERAQGKYCIADIAVTNNANTPITVTDSDFTAYAGDAEYAPDTMASISSNIEAGRNTTFIEGVNPGNTVRSNVVFDVPADAAIDRFEVRDGFSTVTIANKKGTP